MSAVGFLAAQAPDADAQRLFDDDVAELGYVMNVSRLWAYQPATLNHLFDLMGETYATEVSTFRQRGILVTACASTLGDAYCSLAWGTKLAASPTREQPQGSSGALMIASVPKSRRWRSGLARSCATRIDIGAADVQALRDAGYSDAQIFGMTVYIALRLAFSTINDALGARPDSAFRSSAPKAVLDAVDYGRPIDE